MSSEREHALWEQSPWNPRWSDSPSHQCSGLHMFSSVSYISPSLCSTRTHTRVHTCTTHMHTVHNTHMCTTHTHTQCTHVHTVPNTHTYTCAQCTHTCTMCAYTCTSLSLQMSPLLFLQCLSFTHLLTTTLSCFESSTALGHHYRNPREEGGPTEEAHLSSGEH